MQWSSEHKVLFVGLIFIVVTLVVIGLLYLLLRRRRTRTTVVFIIIVGMVEGLVIAFASLVIFSLKALPWMMLISICFSVVLFIINLRYRKKQRQKKNNS